MKLTLLLKKQAFLTLLNACIANAFVNRLNMLARICDEGAKANYILTLFNNLLGTDFTELFN